MTPRKTLSAQNPAQRPAHDGAANRVAHPSGDRLAEIARDLTGNAVRHRAGDLPRDQLTGRQPVAARIVRPEDRAEHASDLAEDSATLLRRSPGARLPGRRLR